MTSKTTHNLSTSKSSGMNPLSSSPGNLDAGSLLDSSRVESRGKSALCTDANKNTISEGKKESKGKRSKKKSSWYNVLYPTYKSRSEDFKRIFKDVPDSERLVVDYSCALQREILVHGRLYISQNYLCFYANIFMWETLVTLRWTDVTSITKERTALIIPNAILVTTESEKFFLTSFGARDKAYLMLFKVWQNALIGQPLSMSEMWQLVHSSYGDELGLTSDDEDYVPPVRSTEATKVENNMDSPTAEKPALSYTENGINLENKQLLRKSSTALEPALDLSDSSDSEVDKSLFNLEVSINTLCTSLHEGRVLCDAILPIRIDHLFTLLFTNSKFFLDFHTARKTTDLVQSAWTQDNQTGKKMRTISLTACLTQAVGPRTSQVTETQIMLPCSRSGHLYCIDVETINSGIPYGDSFSVLTHYCLKRISECETKFTIICQITYKKSMWGIIKGVIEKNCWTGLEDFFGNLVKCLKAECDDIKVREGSETTIKRRSHISGVDTMGHGQGLSGNKSQSLSPSNLLAIKPDLVGALSWILLIAVLCLMLINGLLYYKLFNLEETASYTVMDLHILKETPKTEDDWIQLLQQQENLHSTEMRKWQRMLQTATQLLRKTEESLMELQMSLHPTATEKLFSILRPGSKAYDTNNDHSNANN